MCAQSNVIDAQLPTCMGGYGKRPYPGHEPSVPYRIDH